MAAAKATNDPALNDLTVRAELVEAQQPFDRLKANGY